MSSSLRKFRKFNIKVQISIFQKRKLPVQDKMFSSMADDLGKQQDWCFVLWPSRIEKNSWD